MLAVLCALGSAVMYALASVLQQRGAAAQPAEDALRLTLLARLVRNRMWLLGIGCDVLGYVLQFVALGHGPLVVVQLLLVSGLLFALPMGAAWSGRRLRRPDWVGAALVCAGLAVFLLVASPADGTSNVRPIVWVVILATTGGSALALVLLSFHRPAWQRAVLLSASAGVIYGASAALTKTSSHLLDAGVFHLVVHWQPYVLLVAAVGGMVVAQSAFQAGSLGASLPMMTVVDPVVSIVIGAVAFGESLSSSATAVVLEVIALIGMSGGVFLLARSEAVRSVHQAV